jgi:hypothetical protein
VNSINRPYCFILSANHLLGLRKLSNHYGVHQHPRLASVLSHFNPLNIFATCFSNIDLSIVFQSLVLLPDGPFLPGFIVNSGICRLLVSVSNRCRLTRLHLTMLNILQTATFYFKQQKLQSVSIRKYKKSEFVTYFITCRLRECRAVAAA